MKICVVGLGYVGYPLFELFSERYETYGIDLPNKVSQFNNPKIAFDYSIVDECDVIFVCVPTPVDSEYNPDYRILDNVNDVLSKHIRKEHIIVYESTVGPNVIHNRCLWKVKPNDLTQNKDFFVVYSPERVSPGVTGMDLKDITKLVACPVKETRDKICELYNSVGINTYPCDDYRIAEMSKLLENIQRDVNIALMNEFAMICSKYKGLKFMDVWNAAATKKDFKPFTMGMVGGHCIPVDPYLLLNSWECSTENSVLIRTAREENERMIEVLANDIVKRYGKCKHLCILGASYKENVGDLRESGSLKLYKKLVGKLPSDAYVSLHDPYIDRYSHLPEDADCYILAVPHKFYEGKDFYYNRYFYDVKGVWFGRDHLFTKYYSFGEGEIS